MLSEMNFKMLTYLLANPQRAHTQRELSKTMECSLGKVNAAVANLRHSGLIAPDSIAITEAGILALEPYKVQNAIILAAGMSSRCAPLSYEKPKGLFKIKGDILVERMIRQLKSSGIHEIYLVVGYMKELFFYLEEKYGVHIVINNEYTVRNNISSIYAVREHFGNSYVCYSDNYVAEAAYEPYVYRSYFAGQYSGGYTDEYIMLHNKQGLIHQYYQGGEQAWYQIGEMYFDHTTAKTFLERLETEYDYPGIGQMKIDDFYARHLSELPVYVKKYPENFVREFDTIAEIEAFDTSFIENLGDSILSNICRTLGCAESDITDVHQIKRGLTNTIFRFTCRDKMYVYRHPGRGTEQIIDRTREALAQKAAMEAGMDSSCILLDPVKGWKLSHYVPNRDFSYQSMSDEQAGVDAIRRLHSQPRKLGWELNMVDRAAYMQNLVSSDYYNAYQEFFRLRESIEGLYRYTEQDGYEKCMCHNDACDGNFLLGNSATYLIDWEYAGDNDPAIDIATFIFGCKRTREEVDRILELYFQRPLSFEERRHYYAYIAIGSYFYFSWAIFKESTGQNIGDLTYIWYKFAQEYAQEALKMYQED